ncbi:hypothetical protein BDZ89DRAFT_815187 [Hymenopellis radicata]|nr:hypothetical protein BDZ89DRAFT_815187 [Hymenopellis radicata]
MVILASHSKRRLGFLGAFLKMRHNPKSKPDYRMTRRLRFRSKYIRRTHSSARILQSITVWLISIWRPSSRPKCRSLALRLWLKSSLVAVVGVQVLGCLLYALVTAAGRYQPA